MKALLIIIGIILFFRLFGKYILAFMMKLLFKKMQKQAAGFTNQYTQQSHQKEGEINIKYVPPQKDSQHEPLGEYVDYEEVK